MPDPDIKISLKPENFPLLWASLLDDDPKLAEINSTLADIAVGVEADSIRNVTLTDARAVLSRTVCAAWEQHVDIPFRAQRNKLDGLPKPVLDLYYSLIPTCLRDVIAANKRLEKEARYLVGIQEPMLEAMREFHAETLPLALAVESLKEKAVKGRMTFIENKLQTESSNIKQVV